jgi:hypothetical protein
MVQRKPVYIEQPDAGNRRNQVIGIGVFISCAQRAGCMLTDPYAHEIMLIFKRGSMLMEKILLRNNHMTKIYYCYSSRPATARAVLQV